MPKRTRQKPTIRPQAPKPKRKAPRAPRRGTLPLSPFEREVFQEMARENDELRRQQHRLNQQWEALLRRHNERVEALGKTHGMDFVFTVRLNKDEDALNWSEVLEDGGNESDDGGAGSAPAD